jgi:hypothetical protein
MESSQQYVVVSRPSHVGTDQESLEHFIPSHSENFNTIFFAQVGEDHLDRNFSSVGLSHQRQIEQEPNCGTRFPHFLCKVWEK